MKRVILALMLTAAVLAATDADAQRRRLGGGQSAGKQSQNVTKQTPPATPDAAKAATPAAANAATPAAAPQAALPPKPASPWKGILGGALLGLGLGALLSHLGIGGALAGIISTVLMLALLAGAAYFIYRLVTRKNTAPAMQTAYAGSTGSMGSAAAGSAPVPFRVPEIGAGLKPAAAAAMPAASWSIPADFDVPAFLRSAKTYYIRLQAAWDKGDSSDLRSFTSPEMFAELKLQLQERGAAPNMTDVVSLEAELLGIELIGDEHLASVKFSGTIKDAPGAPAEAFAEVWNISKPQADKEGWVLAGIQQIN